MEIDLSPHVNVKEPNLRASMILPPSPATSKMATLICQRLRLRAGTKPCLTNSCCRRPKT